MYSQHNSELPARIQPTVSVKQTKANIFSFISSKAKLIFSPKTVRLIFSALLCAAGFALIIFCANKIESTLDIGFEPDFQIERTQYSSLNQIFEQYSENVSVTVKMHGEQEFTVNSPLVTVGEMLDDLSLEMSANDVLSVGNDTPLAAGMVIAIDSVDTKTVTMNETIAYTTRYVDSQTVPKGKEVITQNGISGTKTTTLNQTFVNGKLDTETVISEEITKQPQEKIVSRGVGGTFTAKDGTVYSYSYYIDVEATAYGTLSGRTATGKAIKHGMIAVDPSVIPLGTKCYVTGNYGDIGVCSAEDTGGAIKGNKIDVYLGDDMSVLLGFGRRQMRVYIF